MAPPLGSPMRWSRINDFRHRRDHPRAHAAGLGRAWRAPRWRRWPLHPGWFPPARFFLSARSAGASGCRSGAGCRGAHRARSSRHYGLHPGRIDHHALQVVLIQLLVLALMRAPNARAGRRRRAAHGAQPDRRAGNGSPGRRPALGARAFLGVSRHGRARAPCRLRGGTGRTTSVLPCLPAADLLDPLRSCDAFTPASSTAMLAVAAAMGALAVLTPRLRDWRLRD